jgi:phenylalanyl-tRNA synthetase beta chain
MERDLALLVPQELSYADIRQLVARTENKLIRKMRIFDVYQGEQVKTGFKSYAVRLEFENPKQTLEDKVVDKVIQRIISALDKELNVQIR